MENLNRKIRLFEVGGCVRDELLGLESNDIDFTLVLDDLSLSVDEGWERMLDFLKGEGFKIFLEMKDCFTVKAKFPKGSKNEGLVADVVMSRKEVGVIPNTRMPILELGTLFDDLQRRDFTLNALCKDENGSLIDFFNGVEDLENRILVTPLDPMITLLDDPLRMLRGLRFSITKGFDIDPKLWECMNSPQVMDKLMLIVSQERIREELTKMFKFDTLKTLQLLNNFPKLMEFMFKNEGQKMWLMPTNKK